MHVVTCSGAVAPFGQPHSVACCCVARTRLPLYQNRAINLTRDHNPDVPTEEARILSMGGFVSAPPEEGLSARVWLDSGCTQIGLAMSRSIGDHAVMVRALALPRPAACVDSSLVVPQTVGVIAEPEVVRHDITSDDRFMILATDGVWEFIPSQEAVDIVAAEIEHGAEHACRKLIQTAAERYELMLQCTH